MRLARAFVVGGLILLIAAAAMAPFKVAPEEEALIIAHDGRIARKVGDGWHLRIPILQEVYVQKTFLMRQTLVETAKSQDQCTLDIAVQWNIGDLIRFHQVIRKVDAVDSLIARHATERARSIAIFTESDPDLAFAEYLRSDDFQESTGLNITQTRVEVSACP